MVFQVLKGEPFILRHTKKALIFRCLHDSCGILDTDCNDWLKVDEEIAVQMKQIKATRCQQMTADVNVMILDI